MWPAGSGNGAAQIGLDQTVPDLEQLLNELSFRPFVRVLVSNALDHNAQHFGDGIAHRVLADGHDEPPVVVPIKKLFVGRTPPDFVGEQRVFRYLET